MSTVRNPGTSATFRRLGGRTSLDFVNTVGGWEPDEGSNGSVYRILDERLRAYSDLLAWVAPILEDAQLRYLRRASRDQPKLAQEALGHGHELRSALYSIFVSAITQAPSDPAALEVLDRRWRHARESERLTPILGGLAVALGRPEAQPVDALSVLEQPLDLVVLDAVDLLTSPDAARLGRCPGDACGWLFLDTSRSGRRRWCDMRDCGNLAKVRRFRQRRSEGG